uniref:Uncharacterized protein n=1 Tax=Rhizophora mucronata TaxID=61149 RepID=A0A2P2NRU7_RHIMU
MLHLSHYLENLEFSTYPRLLLCTYTY